MIPYPAAGQYYLTLSSHCYSTTQHRYFSFFFDIDILYSRWNLDLKYISWYSISNEHEFTVEMGAFGFFISFIHSLWTYHFLRFLFRLSMVREWFISFVFYFVFCQNCYLFSIYFLRFLTERSFNKIVPSIKSFFKKLDRKIFSLSKERSFLKFVWTNYLEIVH